MLEYIREIWTRMRSGKRKYTVWYMDSPDPWGIRSMILGDLGLRRYDCDALVTTDDPKSPVNLTREGEDKALLVHGSFIIRIRVNYGYAADCEQYADEHGGETPPNKTPDEMREEIEAMFPQVKPVEVPTMYG